MENQDHTSKHPLNEHQIRFRLDGHTHDGRDSSFIPRPQIQPPFVPPKNVPPDVTFSMPGSVTAVISPRHYFNSTISSITGWVIALDTLGSSLTTVQLLKNGNPILDSNGDTIGILTIDPTINNPLTGIPDNPVIGGLFPPILFVGPWIDWLQTIVVFAGDGAKDLTAFVWKSAD